MKRLVNVAYKMDDKRKRLLIAIFLSPVSAAVELFRTVTNLSIWTRAQSFLHAVITSFGVGLKVAPMMGVSTKCQFAVPVGGFGNICAHAGPGRT